MERPVETSRIPLEVIPYLRRWYHDRYAGPVGTLRRLGEAVEADGSHPGNPNSRAATRWPEPSDPRAETHSVPDVRTMLLLPSGSSRDPSALVFCGRWYPDRGRWVAPNPYRALENLVDPAADEGMIPLSEPQTEVELLYRADRDHPFQVESIGDWGVPTHRGRMPLGLSGALRRALEQTRERMRTRPPSRLPHSLRCCMGGVARSVVLPETPGENRTVSA